MRGRLDTAHDHCDYVQMVEEARIPMATLRGRGTATQIQHRFSQEGRQVCDDGWDTVEDAAGVPTAKVTTQVLQEQARSALSSNESPDIYFELSVNPYRGCEHGCVYCYARPTHSYLNLSPGLDFESKIIAKPNIAELLRAELGRKSYQARMICIGSATDCYQPVERGLKLTRGLISVLSDLEHPFSLVTKSSGVERDIDLLAPMAAKKQCAVYVTITTLDTSVTNKLEPRAASPLRRLRTIRTLTDAGIPVGLSLAPQIPFLTEDMEAVMDAAWDAGARSAFYHVLRLPWEVAPLFKEWLEAHYPQRAARIMARVRDMHHGKDYDSDFRTRMKGTGVWADLLASRFQRKAKALGFDRERFVFDFSRFVGMRAAQSDLF